MFTLVSIQCVFGPHLASNSGSTRLPCCVYLTSGLGWMLRSRQYRDNRLSKSSGSLSWSSLSQRDGWNRGVRRRDLPSPPRGLYDSRPARNKPSSKAFHSHAVHHCPLTVFTFLTHRLRDTTVVN